MTTIIDTLRERMNGWLDDTSEVHWDIDQLQENGEQMVLSCREKRWWKNANNVKRSIQGIYNNGEVETLVIEYKRRVEK